MIIWRNLFRLIFLYPLSLLFGIITYTRNRFYDFGFLSSKSFDVAVIGIGNITVGGTGKTPHVEFFVSELQNNFNIAVLSRGYKRHSKGFRLVETETSYIEVGDEPAQIKRKFPQITVAVCSNRRKGIEMLMAKANPVPDLILLDDSFQHRRVKLGISILLTDFNRPMDIDYRLPFGRLRESFHEKRRANIIMVTKVPSTLLPIDKRIIINKINLFPYQDLFYSGILYKEPQMLFSNDLSYSFANSLENLERVLLITGLAKGEPLFAYIRDFYSPNVEWKEYPDHYSFKNKDLDEISTVFNGWTEKRKVIFTTEKDAVRLSDHPSVAKIADLPVFVIPIGIEIMDDKKDELIQSIANYVTKNKRNSQLYR